MPGTAIPRPGERRVRSALDANANLIVLSGDTHNAWAFDLDLGGSAAGVEFGGQSVTSPGIEGSLPKVDPQVVADVGRPQPQLKWANTCNAAT